MYAVRKLLSILLVLVVGALIFNYVFKLYSITFKTEKEYEFRIPLKLCVAYNTSSKNPQDLIQILGEYGVIVSVLNVERLATSKSHTSVLADLYSPCETILFIDFPSKNDTGYEPSLLALLAYADKNFVIFTSTVPEDVLNDTLVFVPNKTVEVREITVYNAPKPKEEDPHSSICFFCIHVPLFFTHQYEDPYPTMYNGTVTEYASVLLYAEVKGRYDNNRNFDDEVPFLVHRGKIFFINMDLSTKKTLNKPYATILLVDLLWYIYHNLYIG